MDPFLAAAAHIVREQQEAFQKVVRESSEAALQWRPAAEANSVAVLVTHAWGAAQTWFVRAAGEEMPRDREAEFHVNFDKNRLLAILDAGGERIASTLKMIEAVDLATERPTPLGRPLSISHCLLHAIAHNQEHLGQAWLTQQLWSEHRGG